MKGRRGRNPIDPGIVLKALRLYDQGVPPRVAAEELGGMISTRTIWKAIGERSRAQKPAPPPSPSLPPPAPPPPIESPPPPSAKAAVTSSDRKIDELVAKSVTWQRVQDALAKALANHPAAAKDVAKALRSLNL